jgi:hypothetical protein
MPERDVPRHTPGAACRAPRITREARTSNRHPSSSSSSSHRPSQAPSHAVAEHRQPKPHLDDRRRPRPRSPTPQPFGEQHEMASSSTKRPAPATSASTPKAQSKQKASLGSILSMPPQWLSSYEEFITKNAGQVSQIESALRSLTYIIPGESICRIL